MTTGTPGSPTARVLLFNADGRDRRIDPGELRLDALSPRQLAWIDVVAPNGEDIAALLERLGLGTLPLPQLLRGHSPAVVEKQGWFTARALAPRTEGGQVHGEPWLLGAGANVVVTVHRVPLPFIEAIWAHADPDSRLGLLDADSFAAALLDRLVTEYLDAVDAFEAEVDEFEVAVLRPRLGRGYLGRLRELRRTISRLRSLLSSHRALFDSLSRPDFRPDGHETVNAHFQAVSARYERAIDAIENARDLVIGSFELLAARLSQRTNDTMRVLTFATVLLGSLAVVAGVLGMNFRAPLFETGARGFWLTIGTMVAIVVAALLLAHARRWFR